MYVSTTFGTTTQARLDDIISPESGIHRPSYNGAPATQTLTLLLVAPACSSNARECSSLNCEVTFVDALSTSLTTRLG